MKISSIYELVYYCWVGMGSAFGPLVIATLYFNKLTKNAAIFGMLFGGAVGLCWIWLDSSISATIPGFIAGGGAILLVSLYEHKTAKALSKNK